MTSVKQVIPEPFTRVDNPDSLLPLLEARHPQNCFISNQIKSSQSLKEYLEFYILGDAIHPNTWILSKHVRKNCADNISIAAPSASLEESEVLKIKKNLSTTTLIDWDSSVIFIALEKHISNIILDISVNQKGNVTEVHPCVLFYMEKEDAKNVTINCPPNATIRRLIPETESDFISSNWKYADEADVPKCIEANPSAGVIINDQCVSGVILPESGQVSALYTRKEHRNKGYAKLAMQFLFKELAKDDYTPCLTVELKNKRAKAFHESLGCKVAAIVDWIAVEKLEID